MDLVLEASAMIAYLRPEAEPGGEVVEELLDDSSHRAYAHLTNVAEVYWNFLKHDDEERAEIAMAALLDGGVEFRDDFETEFCKQAMRWRTVHKVSFADAFGLTLAQRLDAPFVTADSHEMAVIQAMGVHPIRFIRTPVAKTNRERCEQKLEDLLIELRGLDVREGVEGAWRALVRRFS